MHRAFTTYMGDTFSSFLMKHTTVREMEYHDEYTWDLTGSFYKDIPLIEARNETGAVIGASDNNVGLGASTIYLVFPEEYFHKGETLIGERTHYHFRIMDDPIHENKNVVYECELLAGAETGIPGAELQPGKRFSYTYAVVEDQLSREVGGIRANTSTTLRNSWTTIRKDKKFTGAADDQQRMDISMTVTDEKGKDRVINSWFDNEFWIFTQEWENEKEFARLYSRSNRNSNGSYLNVGVSGNVLKEGDGIYAQMEYGNTHYYNNFNDDFDIEGLTDAIYSLFERSGIPFNQGTILIATGNRGMAQASKAIDKLTNGWTKASGWTVNADGLGIVKPTKNAAHPTSLQFGYQFTDYIAPNGLHIAFFLDRALDDRRWNKLEGPNGKGVLSSYAYYIFDLGAQGNQNMYICKPKGQQYADYYRYILGMRNPFGLTGNIISSTEDASSVHTMTTLGAYIADPTRCMMYLPAGLY
ncbi:MAG: hypothetical protein HUJ56_10245 [Erysipelotrichaceae bacterium]|nr:hypothetical protein [Erysipelotrichaceae bacterium]